MEVLDSCVYDSCNWFFRLTTGGELLARGPRSSKVSLLSFKTTLVFKSLSDGKYVIFEGDTDDELFCSFRHHSSISMLRQDGKYQVRLMLSTPQLIHTFRGVAYQVTVSQLGNVLTVTDYTAK